MKKAIILHGTCGDIEYNDPLQLPLCCNHWFPWLQKQLLISGVHARTPQMPEAHKPDYEKWKKEFDMNIDEDVKILVGHSCGGGFILRWLSENTLTFETVVLVAPWLDPNRVKLLISLILKLIIISLLVLTIFRYLCRRMTIKIY